MDNLDWLDLLHPESPVRQYMQWIGQSGNEELYRERYRGMVEAQKKEASCFLSVIIRTQGKRREMLQDVLLCLQAQRDQDFEVLLICHRAEKEAVRGIRELVKLQERDLGKKIRVLECDGGERGAPLNLGFASARGRYMVCLDDDDLVLDSWVQRFHQAEEAAGGQILHSWVLTQDWQAHTDPGDGRQRLRASGSPDSRYCVPYRTLRQQGENYCPFMGMAFPGMLFRDFHILFDETLTTTEDWDYILRTAGIAGVKDIPEVTAIYRLWNTKDVSRAQIQEPEWKNNYLNIGRKTDGAPLLMTAGEASECRGELRGLQSAGQKGRSSFLREAVLFWSDGEPFSDRQYMAAPVGMKDGWLRAEFPLEKKCREGEIRRLRIDPAEETLFTLDHIRVRLMDGEEKLGELTEKNIRETNGMINEGSILFLAEDPRIIFDVREKVKPCTVVFTARVTYRSPEILCLAAEDLCADARWLADNRDISRVYLDRGEGFTLSDSVFCDNAFREDGYRAVFEIPPELASGVKEARFDPTEAEMLWMDGLRITLTFEDGGETELHADQMNRINGFETGEGLAFIGRDPWMCFEIPAGRELRRMEVRAKAEFIGGERMEDLFAEAKRVSNYRLICDQLRRMRADRRKKEAETSHDSE